MKIRQIIGNLWIWVVAAFLLVILGWYWTVRIANQYDFSPPAEGETLERQLPDSGHPPHP
ncbi:MAG: hypothetical protein ABQ298_14085 [Puniceicoccaceae bacterium]